MCNFKQARNSIADIVFKWKSKPIKQSHRLVFSCILSLQYFVIFYCISYFVVVVTAAAIFLFCSCSLFFFIYRLCLTFEYTYPFITTATVATITYVLDFSLQFTATAMESVHTCKIQFNNIILLSNRHFSVVYVLTLIYTFIFLFGRLFIYCLILFVPRKMFIPTETKKT